MTMGLFRRSHARHAAKSGRAARRAAAERTAQAEAKPPPPPPPPQPQAHDHADEAHSQTNPPPAK